MILNNVANNSVETKSELEVNYITQKKEQEAFLVLMFDKECTVSSSKPNGNEGTTIALRGEGTFRS